MSYFAIDPDAPLFGCNRLGHAWDKHGDCYHCSANADDDNQPGEQSD